MAPSPSAFSTDVDTGSREENATKQELGAASRFEEKRRRSRTKQRQIGILLFDGVEELDVVGPFEVFGWAASQRKDLFAIATVAEQGDPIRCSKGLRLIPDHTLESCPSLDIILVPGGAGTRAAAQNPTLLDFVADRARQCEYVVSVCTGLRVLLAAGLAVGKRVTTYHGAVDEIRKTGLAAAVLDDVRYVRDGNLITSAGVSAGIDMALWLVGEITGDPPFARQVQRGIEYFPAPPYAADV